MCLFMLLTLTLPMHVVFNALFQHQNQIKIKTKNVRKRIEIVIPETTQAER